MGADDREAIVTELEQRWTGQEFLEEIRQEEMRAIIRQHMAVENVPHRQRMAREIGLSVHRLRLFLDGAPLHPHEWDQVAPWCADKPEPNPRVSPYAVEVGVLCEWFRVAVALLAEIERQELPPPACEPESDTPIAALARRLAARVRRWRRYQRGARVQRA